MGRELGVVPGEAKALEQQATKVQQTVWKDSAAIFAIQGRWRLPFIGGIDVQLARQLPGKPEAGGGSKLVGSY